MFSSVLPHDDSIPLTAAVAARSRKINDLKMGLSSSRFTPVPARRQRRHFPNVSDPEGQPCPVKRQTDKNCKSLLLSLLKPRQVADKDCPHDSSGDCVRQARAAPISLSRRDSSF